MSPWLLCGLLAALALALWARLRLLQKSLDDISRQLGAWLAADTNNPIFLAGGDRHAKKLAAALNRYLKELRRARRRYETGDRELKEAVTGLSHDLRTPLTAIFGYLELLEGQETTPAAARWLAILRERAERMAALVEELFGYSLLLSAQPDAPAAPVNINAMLEESLAAFYTAFAQRGITPQVSLPQPPVFRRLDGELLGRVLANLLSNAVKYSAGDLTVTMDAVGTVTFANTAPGLSAVQVGRLFDRFYTVFAGPQATGLGLAIAKTLTQRLGGDLSAQYAGGRLTLTLQLPPQTEAPPDTPGAVPQEH